MMVLFLVVVGLNEFGNQHFVSAYIVTHKKNSLDTRAYRIFRIC